MVHIIWYTLRMGHMIYTIQFFLWWIFDDADDVAAINKTGLIDLPTLRLYSLKTKYLVCSGF